MSDILTSLRCVGQPQTVGSIGPVCMDLHGMQMSHGERSQTVTAEMFKEVSVEMRARISLYVYSK